MVGIVLAGGYSSRFPEYKLTQHINKKTLIEHTIDQLSEFVSIIYIVTGHNHKDIETLFELNKSVICLFNESFDDGMFSSVKKGSLQVDETCFIIPGDCPFVKKSTYEILSNAEGEVIIPSFNMKCGHPIRLSKTVVKDLRTSCDGNLREFLNRFKKTYVRVNDPWILIDIDTKENYEAVKRRLESENNGSC